jgi:hypothetical protein
MLKPMNLWIVILAFCFSETAVVPAETFPSFQELRQLHQKHFQSLQRGQLNIRYQMTKKVDEEAIQQYKQHKEVLEELHQERWANSWASLSPEMRENIAKAHENALQNLLKFYSGRTEADWICRIDIPGRLFWKREIPLWEKQENNETLNGAWNRFLLVNGQGHWLSYSLDDDSVSVDPISAKAFETAYADILYHGLLTPRQWEKMDQATSVQKGKLQERDVVIYEIVYSQKPDSKLIIYATPEAEYRYLKTEFFNQNHLRLVQIAQDYQRIDGLYYPMHFERIRYNTTTGEEEEREVFQIQAARFNQPFEPNAFTIELKPSTSITVDLPPDISFKVFRLPHEKSLRLGLDEIVEEARRAPELFTVIRQKEE